MGEVKSWPQQTPATRRRATAFVTSVIVKVCFAVASIGSRSTTRGDPDRVVEIQNSSRIGSPPLGSRLRVRFVASLYVESSGTPKCL